MNYNKTASILDQAAASAQSIDQISKQQQFNLEEAYAIQSISIGRRFQRGEKLLGYKMGFTSRAKMEQMGVHDLIWGKLTDKMHFSSGDELPMDDFIHPRAEPEIAFLVDQDVNEKVTLENAASFVNGLAVAIEIIDSRYENFKFSLEDVIADNCSSAGFAIGEWMPVGTSIRDIPIALSINEEVAHAGNSNAILGNPWESFVEAARLIADSGEQLSKGMIILAGAATPAVYIKQGQSIKATATGLGTVSLKAI